MAGDIAAILRHQGQRRIARVAERVDQIGLSLLTEGGGDGAPYSAAVVP